MPATIRSLPHPSKKRRTNPPSTSSPEYRIKSLESTLTAAIQSSASLNPLVDLLDLALTTTEPPDVSKALYALYRVFVILVGSGKLTTASGDDERAKVVRAWLWDQLGAYSDLLVGLMKDADAGLRISSLQILFSLQKHLSSALSSSQLKFHVSHFKKIVQGLLACPSSPRMGTSRDDNIEKRRLEPDVRECFVNTWFSVHDDVRWFFLREAVSVLNTSASVNPHIPANLLSILECLTTFPTEHAELNSWLVHELGAKPVMVNKSKATAGPFDTKEGDNDDEDIEDGGEEDDWRKFFDEPTPSSTGNTSKPHTRLHKLTVHQSLHSLASHRAVFTRAWLALLPMLNFSAGTQKEAENEKREAGDSRKLTLRALNVMHRGVMPHLTRAILVMDWVGECVDYGGTIGLLALNALFVLMTEYNLDYPSFYTRLYAFLDRDILHSKHRARFFRLTELFLGSTHLPAILLASFIKRLSLLSLNAPPAAIIMIIPFTYNVLKRHPALMVMIHRAPEGDDDATFADPFRPNEPNPNLTDALASSLWELYSHKKHYHAGVSTLARVFEEAFTKPGYGMEDFLDHGYGTLLDTEMNRKIKRDPALAMDMKSNIFPANQRFEEEQDTALGDIISDLWHFS